MSSEKREKSAGWLAFLSFLTSLFTYSSLFRHLTYLGVAGYMSGFAKTFDRHASALPAFMGFA
ncbi:hypothetical protein SAMN04487785_107116 [Dyella jiangningensis]|nr:hypothetical protein BDW41_107130 [Dyella sp. AtDHG13]SDK39190.1 hypothetical protein SAMN04487785_107116 [Dyella jiangningensis]